MQWKLLRISNPLTQGYLCSSSATCFFDACGAVILHKTGQYKSLNNNSNNPCAAFKVGDNRYPSTWVFLKRANPVPNSTLQKATSQAMFQIFAEKTPKMKLL